MHFTGYGWMKVYLIMDEYHAVYIPRDDLNLDVEILKIRWARDGMSIEARQHFTNFEELLDVKIVMHSYDAESNQLKVCLEQMAQITYNQVRSMIRNEVENWPRYDEWYNERIQADRDKRGTWRAKWSGKHIGRYEDKGDACQAYYDYCLAHGYSVE